MKQKGTAYKLLIDRHLCFCAFVLPAKKKVSAATAKSIVLIAMASQCQTLVERSHIIFALKRKTSDWLKMSTKRLGYVSIQGHCHCRNSFKIN